MTDKIMKIMRKYVTKDYEVGAFIHVSYLKTIAEEIDNLYNGENKYFSPELPEASRIAMEEIEKNRHCEAKLNKYFAPKNISVDVDLDEVDTYINRDY